MKKIFLTSAGIIFAAMTVYPSDCSAQESSKDKEQGKEQLLCLVWENIATSLPARPGQDNCRVSQTLIAGSIMSHLLPVRVTTGIPIR